MPGLTIFTPTYNRAYILPQLYASLCRQSSTDFEWLIVDDGSTDNTAGLATQWIAENKIAMRYIRQENGGKHRAINRGIKEARGQLFFIVDSDDCLTDDAVQWINATAGSILADDNFCGISGIRVTPQGDKIGGGADFGTIDCNAIDLRLKHGIAGDLAEVFKTDVLRKYLFPEIAGEKFCPEALVWNRLARRYNMRFVHHGIYVCEYLPDGLTAKITKLRHQSPKASATYYAEHFRDNISLKWRIKAAINFWRFFDGKNLTRYRMLSPLSLACAIPGRIIHFYDILK